MNASSLIRFFRSQKILDFSKIKIENLTKQIGSDVKLGLDYKDKILYSNGKIKTLSTKKQLFVIVIKPNFGCSTKDIYSQVKKFDKIKFRNPSKKMFDCIFLKKMNNSLEKIVLNRYSTLKRIKSYLINLENPVFVRMTGSGSALVSYYYSKKQCDKAQKQFNKDHKKYWCISSKTI